MNTDKKEIDSPLKYDARNENTFFQLRNNDLVSRPPSVIMSLYQCLSVFICGFNESSEQLR
jgi:hypothetical protein